jgi:hypothetical protein
MSLFLNAPLPFIAGAAAGPPVTQFTHVGHSYERSTTNTSTKTFTPPSGAQAGDLLILATFIDRNAEITSVPSGWTEIGNTAIATGDNFPEGYSYYHIYNGTDSSWTFTWDAADTSAGIVVAFRPDSTITTVTIPAFEGSYSSGTLSDTISTVTDDPAVGGRIYMYFLTGRPTATLVQDPAPTFTPSSGWTHVDGDLPAPDNMDYAYKLAAAGDAFVSTTITTTDGGQQTQHFFIVDAV